MTCNLLWVTYKQSTFIARLNRFIELKLTETLYWIFLAPHNISGKGRIFYRIS